MSLFSRKTDDRKKQIEPLLFLKKTLDRKKFDEPTVSYENMEDIKEKLNVIFKKLTDLDSKIETIDKDKISKLADDISFKLDKSKNKPDGVRKKKVKNMVYALLNEHDRLTAFQLSRMLNLSRTRCSEYLKELERTGILTATTTSRKRYYEIRQ